MNREATKALDVAERLMATCDVLAEIAQDRFEIYEADARTRWAVELGLIRLGEEVGRLPDEIRRRFPDQPWRIIIDMRNRVAHQYDIFATRRVWNTVVHDIPALRRYVAEVMVPALRSHEGTGRSMRQQGVPRVGCLRRRTPLKEADDGRSRRRWLRSVPIR